MSNAITLPYKRFQTLFIPLREVKRSAYGVSNLLVLPALRIEGILQRDLTFQRAPRVEKPVGGIVVEPRFQDLALRAVSS
jgi:hypothetical protein